MQNMNVELVAQMFKNYQSNVLFHLEGKPQSSHHHNVAEIFQKQPKILRIQYEIDWAGVQCNTVHNFSIFWAVQMVLLAQVNSAIP